MAHYRIPKDVTAELKINKALYLADLLWLIAILMFGFIAGGFVYPPLKIPFYIFLGVVGIVMIIRPASNPKKRMYQAILIAFVRNRTVYCSMDKPDAEEEIDVSTSKDKSNDLAPRRVKEAMFPKLNLFMKEKLSYKKKKEEDLPKKPFIEESKSQSYRTSIFDESHLKTQKHKEQKKPEIKLNVSEIIPVVDITANGNFELRGDEGYMDIVQLTSKDIYSLNEEDKKKDIYMFAFFLQSFLEDFKIVPLNFSVDTGEQQRAVERKLERTKNPVHIPFLEQKLEELQFISANRFNREYYLFLYAKDEYTLTNNVNRVETLLHRVLPINKMDDEKKINILYKLFNLNSKNKKSEGW